MTRAPLALLPPLALLALAVGALAAAGCTATSRGAGPPGAAGHPSSPVPRVSPAPTVSGAGPEVAYADPGAAANGLLVVLVTGPGQLPSAYRSFLELAGRQGFAAVGVTDLSGAAMVLSGLAQTDPSGGWSGYLDPTVTPPVPQWQATVVVAAGEPLPAAVAGLKPRGTATLSTPPGTQSSCPAATARAWAAALAKAANSAGPAC